MESYLDQISLILTSPLPADRPFECSHAGESLQLLSFDDTSAEDALDLLWVLSFHLEAKVCLPALGACPLIAGVPGIAGLR